MTGFAGKLYRDDGVVLRVQRLGESDRIVTFLTRRHGRVRAVAKGIRKTTSRFGGRLEPFGHVDVQFMQGRNLEGIRQVEGIELFARKFFDDYGRYTIASAIAEAAERLTPIEREPSLRLFTLSLGALRALAAGEHSASLVLDAYLVRAMAVAGWAPALRDCAVCGSEGPHGAFSVPAGGLVCLGCRPPGASRPSPAAVALMAALAEGDWALADAAGQTEQRQASGLIAALLQWHLERGLRSLALVDRTTTPGVGTVADRSEPDRGEPVRP